MILKFMSIEELHGRLMDVKTQLEKVEARIHQPPAYQLYNPRNDLSLAAELHKYVIDIKTELNLRAGPLT